MIPESKVEIGAAMSDVLAFLRTAEIDDESRERSEESAPYFLSKISDQAGIVYEKMLNALDNKEEHFLRRYAIRRIAKRIMWFSDDPQVITRGLLQDLYRGHYLSKASVTRPREEDVRRTISAFLLLSAAIEASVSVTEFLQLRKYLLDIVAGAIEDRLYLTHNEEASVRLLARITDDTLVTIGLTLDKSSRELVVYATAWRSLFAADSALLLYKLWLVHYPNWENADTETLSGLAHVFPEFMTSAQGIIEHDLGKRLQPRLRNYSIAVTVLYELLEHYDAGVETLIANRADFEARIRAVVVEKYKQDISRASRRAWQAIIYIFATKTLLAVVVESLYLSVWKASINYVAVATNIVFHPTMLFILTSGLALPPKQNTDRLTLLVKDIVYGGPLPQIVLTPKRFGIISDIALGLYVAVLGATFAWITWTLLSFGFHYVDIAFFLVFLALVLYFGFRIRYAARRMELTGAREGFLRSLAELFMLPIVSVGRWLVVRFERLNLIAIFMDFFIEIPLKLILQFFDTFSSVLKEKKDEIYS